MAVRLRRAGIRVALGACLLILGGCNATPRATINAQAARAAVVVTTTVPSTTVPSTTAVPTARQVTEAAWAPFATTGGITLLQPSLRVERVGFHESNHDGAQQLDALPTAVAPVTVETRDRPTGSRTAADVVVDPDIEIRAPVTGRVKRAGRYTLYCKYSDDFVVIAPDDHPAWEVKVLHIDGVRVRAGNRVVAGETVLAPRPTVLPFESQVDQFRTADPAWPHVHIEVVDPSVRDRPGPGCT